MKRPKIKPHYRVEIVEPKNVYLLSESSSHALTGKLYCQITPLLDGKNTIDDIISKLQGKTNFLEIFQIINRLEAKGYLSEAIDELTPEAAAFWSLLNVEPQIAYRCLQQTQVFVTSVGDIPTQPLITALKELGITASECGIDFPKTEKSLVVVLTDDYLQPNLNQINYSAIETNQPWLLVKPFGGSIWIGPIFHPGKTGCWECLNHRLSGNREIETFVLQQKDQQENNSQSKTSIPASPAVLSSTMQTALNLTATEIAKWIIKNSSEDENTFFSTLEGKILTLNQLNPNLQTHILPQRPQCRACGEVPDSNQQILQPLNLSSRKKKFTSDGGHRAFSPEQTFTKYEHLISPITGVVSSFVRISDSDSSLVHTYVAAHKFMTASKLEGLRESLNHKSAGKGKTDRQAKASALCEAIERYSGVYEGNEKRITSTFKELGDKAIHPANCLHFSPSQYQNREELNNKSLVGHDWIPQPFDETKAIDWTPVWSLTEQTHKYVPTALCYYGYPLPKDHLFCSANSNGNAAGNTLEEAILQGFMELVERDSVGIWWYNRLSRAAVDLASFDDSYLLELQTLYQSKNRDLWVLDLTTDLNIPAFAAVSRCIDGEHEKIMMGCGAHLDPKIAILRAVTEVNQKSTGVDIHDVNVSKASPALQQWLTTATLTNNSYLAPNAEIPPKVYGDYQKRWTDDIYQDVLTCVEIVNNAQMETLVLDQTRPDIGLNVVKVIVPGLRHFWSRFGAGRLYDVPVKMGWLSKPLTEEQMNRTPMPF